MKLFNISLILAVVVAASAVGCGTSTPTAVVGSGVGRVACTNGVGAAGAANPYASQYGQYGSQSNCFYYPSVGQVYCGGATGATGAYGSPYGTGVAGASGYGCTCQGGYISNQTQTQCMPTNQCTVGTTTNPSTGQPICNQA